MSDLASTGGAPAVPSLTGLSVGDEVARADFPITRLTLIKYAGASGDFNVIHWNQRVAQSVGLPDVIAHGMLTMAEAGRVVTDWLGDPGRLLEFGVRFTRPVAVPDDDAGTVVTVTATVAALDDSGEVRLDLKATVDGQTVLGKAFARVSLA